MWSMDTNSFIKFTIRSVFSSSKAASIWNVNIKWNNYTSSKIYKKNGLYLICERIKAMDTNDFCPPDNSSKA